MAEPKKRTWIIVVLVLIFAAPMTVSSFLFFFTDAGRDAAGHGELIEPAVQLPDLPLIDPAGRQVGPHLHGKWTLIYAVDGDCGEDCEAHLYKLRQLRLAQGRHAHRLQRVLAVEGDPGAALSPAQQDQYPGQLLLDRRAGGDIVPADGALYLADPLGNLMMRYPPDTPPEGIVRDLKRLLRYSQIG